MDAFSNLFNKQHRSELVLFILMVIYLLLGIQLPDSFSAVVDSLVGRLAIVGMVIYLFMKANPVLAVIAAIVAFDILRKSSANTGYHDFLAYSPSEEKKSCQFAAFNQFPYTLEQEVVAKMAPLVYSGSPIDTSSYKPVLDNLYDASTL